MVGQGKIEECITLTNVELKNIISLRFANTFFYLAINLSIYL